MAVTLACRQTKLAGRSRGAVLCMEDDSKVDFFCYGRQKVEGPNQHTVHTGRSILFPRAKHLVPRRALGVDGKQDGPCVGGMRPLVPPPCNHLHGHSFAGALQVCGAVPLSGQAPLGPILGWSEANECVAWGLAR